MFIMFGRTGAPQKGAPRARECRTAARYFFSGGLRATVRGVAKAELNDIT